MSARLCGLLPVNARMPYQIGCDRYVDERDGDIQVLCETVQGRKIDAAGDGGDDGCE